MPRVLLGSGTLIKPPVFRRLRASSRAGVFFHHDTAVGAWVKENPAGISHSDGVPAPLYERGTAKGLLGNATGGPVFRAARRRNPVVAHWVAS